jgi:hypothetical protein
LLIVCSDWLLSRCFIGPKGSSKGGRVLLGPSPRRIPGSRASVLSCRATARVPPTRRAFRPSAEGRVTFLLLAQKKSNPKKMAFRAPVASCGIQAVELEVIGTDRSIRQAVRLPRNAPWRRGALHGVGYKRWRFRSPDCDRRSAATPRLHRNASMPRGLKATARFTTWRVSVFVGARWRASVASRSCLKAWVREERPVR